MRLVRLSGSAMQALLAGDLSAASLAAGVSLTSYFTDPDSTWLWRVRLEQMHRDPASAEWVARAAVDDGTGEVVGHAGYHGPPDVDGMVEVGYAVDPRCRGRGHGGRMLTELVRRAEADASVRTLRASVRPSNAPSLAMITAAGFHRTGEQWDDDDGLELVFELPV